MYTSIDPSSGRELGRYPHHDSATIGAALDAAAAAQKEWRFSPVVRRAELLTGLAKVLRAEKRRFAELVTQEMGKPIAESLGEIEKCAVTCDFYAENAKAFLADEPFVLEAGRGALAFEPLGVVLAIMPWNYPFWQFFRFAAPALVAGNGVILKHASNVPQSALAIADAMAAAGCPAGLFANVFVPGEGVSEIIAADRIAAVTFTGSTTVGSLVAAAAGRSLKKQVLELGGSDPFIVLADADLDTAARMAVKARFLNNGQSCINAKRFIVEAACADEFVQRMQTQTEKLKLGDPMDPATAIGPMARDNLRWALHDQVERTIAAGATLVTGGAPLDGDGFYYPPTILDHVTPQMAAFTEETFGPVAAIIRASDADEAIRLANDSEYGLGSSLWTSDLARGQQLARRIDAGIVFINRLVASDPRYPFGGIKRSGYGRELGSYGLREFINIKTMVIEEPSPLATAAPAIHEAAPQLDSNTRLLFAARPKTYVGRN